MRYNVTVHQSSVLFFICLAQDIMFIMIRVLMMMMMIIIVIIFTIIIIIASSKPLTHNKARRRFIEMFEQRKFQEHVNMYQPIDNHCNCFTLWSNTASYYI